MSIARNLFVAALSLGLTIGISACSDKTEKTSKTPEKKTELNKDDHGHKPGPHGGDIVDLGNHEYRGEIVVKEDEPREFTIYLLGHDDDKPVFSKDKEISVYFKHDGKDLEFKLLAAPQAGDADGLTSRFQVKGDALPKELKDEHDLEGGHFDVNIMVKDKSKPYSVEFESHDDHDHGKDDKKK